ncbi:MAG: thioredoxin domain-containing protein [Coriobacteriia bacterium]|nr:thioredoxin domain-containing protein [Coriobacteriia bacterium]
MAPVVDRLKTEYEGTVEFRLVNVDTDSEGQALMTKYNAQFVPTFVFLNADGSVGQMIVGAQEETVLRDALDALK